MLIWRPSPLKYDCDLVLGNRRYPHIFQNSFYLFFVVYRDRGMDWPAKLELHKCGIGLGDIPVTAGAIPV